MRHLVVLVLLASLAVAGLATAEDGPIRVGGFVEVRLPPEDLHGRPIPPDPALVLYLMDRYESAPDIPVGVQQHLAGPRGVIVEISLEAAAPQPLSAYVLVVEIRGADGNTLLYPVPIPLRARDLAVSSLAAPIFALGGVTFGAQDPHEKRLAIVGNVSPQVPGEAPVPESPMDDPPSGVASDECWQC